MRIALIDLGTNSIRLFAYTIEPNGSYQPLFREKETVRLGDNLFHGKTLNWKAYRRTVSAFGRFKKEIDRLQIDRVWAVGTSAMREASDRERLIEVIRNRTGIDLEVISGKREAELIAQGVLDNYSLPKEPVLLVDIGGGSTELTWYAHSEIRYSFSMKAGAARGQQVFLKTVPPELDRSGENGLREHVRTLLHEHAQQMPKEGYTFALGTSGSLRALEKIANGAKSGVYEYRRPFVTDFIERIRLLSRDELRKIPHLEERRIDLILSAALILDEVLIFFGVDEIRTTKCALKDGMLSVVCREIQEGKSIRAFR